MVDIYRLNQYWLNNREIGSSGEGIWGKQEGKEVVEKEKRNEKGSGWWACSGILQLVTACHPPDFETYFYFFVGFCIPGLISY